MILHEPDELVAIEAPGVKFPEGPRWHDGRFLLSDQLGSHVWALTTDGVLTPTFSVPRPSGLGFLADGSTLVASMAEPVILRAHGGQVETWADLGSLDGNLNDLVVEPRGRVYADLFAGDDNEVGKLVFVEDGEEPRVVAAGLSFPNGVAVTPDGTTLLVSETFAARVSAFDIEADGTLTNRRVWAAVDGMSPDGLCLDAEGAVWVASYRAGEFLRIRRGGEIVERILLAPRWAMSCALGGDDGRTLLLCTAETSTRDYLAGTSTGHLDVVRVEAPGVGCL